MPLSTPPYVTVELDYPYSEIKRARWGITRNSAFFQFTEVIDRGGDFLGPRYHTPKVGPPDNIWVEPNTGVLMMKPSYMKQDYEESADYNGFHFGQVDLDFVAGELKFVTGNTLAAPSSMYSKSALTSRTSASNLIGLLAEIAIQAILDTMNRTMVVIAKTKDSLLPNEGWAALVSTFGTASDRGEDYSLFTFGQKFALAVRLDGTANLRYNYATPEEIAVDDHKWRIIKHFSFSDTGIDHGKAFHVSVIPWGKDYLSINFTQKPNMYGGFMLSAHLGTSINSSTLIKLSDYGIETEWDASINQFIKTKAGKLAVSIRADLHQYMFRLSKVRYPQTVTFKMAPEFIGPDSIGVAPSRYLYGFYDYDESLEGLGPKITSEVKNDRGEAWSEMDFKAMLNFTMESSTNRVYTPELWAYDMWVDPETYTPDYTPYDASAFWNFIGFKLSNKLETSAVTIKFDNFQTKFSSMLRQSGPYRISIVHPGTTTGKTMYLEGYFHRSNPTMESRRVLVDEKEGYDFWERLDTTPIGDDLSLDNKDLGTLLLSILFRAGFPEEEVEIDPDISMLGIEGFQKANDNRTINPDAYCGDVIRDLLKHYGIQGHDFIRLRRRDQMWKATLSPAYTEPVPDDPETEEDETVVATEVNTIFYLHSSAVPPGLSDIARWNPDLAGSGIQYFKASSNFEPIIKIPEFNALKATTSEGTGNESQGLQVFIGPPAGVLDDPDSVAFEGRLRAKVLGPPEMVAATQNELERQARQAYKLGRSGMRTWDIEAEWQPSIDCDQLIVVLGVDLTNTPCSFGVWRIEDADVEMRRDQENRVWEWNANYQLTYVGKTDIDGWPMFTEELP